MHKLKPLSSLSSKEAQNEYFSTSRQNFESHDKTVSMAWVVLGTKYTHPLATGLSLAAGILERPVNEH